MLSFNFCRVFSSVVAARAPLFFSRPRLLAGSRDGAHGRAAAADEFLIRFPFFSCFVWAEEFKEGSGKGNGSCATG